jgi:hypothetical protein
MRFGFGFNSSWTMLAYTPFLLPAADFMNAFWHCIGAIYFLVDTLDPFLSVGFGETEKDREG